MPKHQRTLCMVLVASVLVACGDDEGAKPSPSEFDELDAASAACESAAVDVAPGGTLFLASRQSVAEVRVTEADLWPTSQGMTE